MKRLILMRHAKSSWDDPAQRDIDRPLNGRGRRNATLMGHWLKREGYLPGHALVSVAERTRETWARLQETAGEGPVDFVRELYAAGPEAMLRVLQGAPGAGTLLMLGHQPGIGAFARLLLREAPADTDFARFPTAATAVIDFDAADWAEVGWGTGRLVAFTVPRALEDS